jgi:hypothetical protein
VPRHRQPASVDEREHVGHQKRLVAALAVDAAARELPGAQISRLNNGGVRSGSAIT